MPVENLLQFAPFGTGLAQAHRRALLAPPNSAIVSQPIHQDLTLQALPNALKNKALSLVPGIQSAKNETIAGRAAWVTALVLRCAQVSVGPQPKGLKESILPLLSQHFRGSFGVPGGRQALGTVCYPIRRSGTECRIFRQQIRFLGLQRVRRRVVGIFIFGRILVHVNARQTGE